MAGYVARRLLLVLPTLFGILLVNFTIVQFAPGGPVEQLVAQLEGADAGLAGRLGGGEGAGAADTGSYRGGQGLDPAFIQELEKQFGFDRPAHERFLRMVGDYLRFDLGESFFRNQRVADIILEKLPVSLSLALWTTLIVYAVSIPLGIAKAVRQGSRFDAWTSLAVVVGYAVPGFMVGILLVVLFAGGQYLSWFPLRGIASETWADLSWPARVADYAWHMALPVTTLVLGAFATVTLLTRNSFLEEVGKQYVTTARAKGLSPRRVLLGHVFRNAMLVVAANFPQYLLGLLFGGALLVEVIFSLDGMGLLAFEAALSRDYPVVFGTLFVFTLVGLLANLLTDLLYVLIDPRIDFAARGA